LLIQRFSPDAIINTGSAGRFDPELNIVDVVIAEQLLHHDFDATHFCSELGHVPQLPLFYSIDKMVVGIASYSLSTVSGSTVILGLNISCTSIY